MGLQFTKSFICDNVCSPIGTNVEYDNGITSLTMLWVSVILDKFVFQFYNTVCDRIAHFRYFTFSINGFSTRSQSSFETRTSTRFTTVEPLTLVCIDYLLFLNNIMYRPCHTSIAETLFRSCQKLSTCPPDRIYESNRAGLSVSSSRISVHLNRRE